MFNILIGIGCLWVATLPKLSDLGRISLVMIGLANIVFAFFTKG